jgi:hypothetical protein
VTEVAVAAGDQVPLGATLVVVTEPSEDESA